MKKTILKATDFILDHIVHPIRPLLFPFFLLQKIFSVAFRLVFLLSNEFQKLRLRKCGLGVRLHGRIHISSPQNMSIGNNTHINDGAFLKTEGSLTIGDNCHISRNLLVYTINHRYEGDLLPYDHHMTQKPVHIGSNVWIGMNVIIIPGVEIGEGAIIGMGSVVTKTVPPLAIVGGNPAQTLKFRDKKKYDKLKFEKKFSGMSGFHVSTQKFRK